MKKRAARLVWLGILLLPATVWPKSGHAFYNTPVGSTVSNAKLPLLAGGEASLLGKADANVFIFFRPGHENSMRALTQLAACGDLLKRDHVRLVAVVSGRYPNAEVAKAVKATGYAGPVLIDRGDALYGRIGVSLHPSLGIANAKHRLVAYQPFTRLNYCAKAAARVRHVLGEITEKELAAILEPPKATQGGNGATARRNLNFAKMLFDAKKYDKAMAKARRSAELDPALAAAPALIGAILAAQGKCADAIAAFDRALAIDPEDAIAKKGKSDCQTAR